MADNNTNKLVLLISNGANDDKSTVGFTIANAALSTGMEVGIFLTSDAVELSRHGACELTHVKPFKKLEELIDGFVENGGQLWSCSPCFQHRGLNDKETVEKALVTGAGPLLEWIQAGAATISI